MKNAILTGVFSFVLIFWTNIVFAQDVIILKNGDEIKSKVIEVTPEVVKYKKWDNQEGPTYSSNKSEVFMIKYTNGTKDVFNSTSLPTPTSSQKSDGSKFFGTWYKRNYDGINNKTTLTISRAGEDFLIDYKVYVRVDEYFHDEQGSFKEVGRMEGNSIVLNGLQKVSMINDNTILMSSDEFYRYPGNRQPNNVNTSTPAKKLEESQGSVNSTIINQLSSIKPIIGDIDIDSVIYKTVIIGKQTWMVDNLKTTKYNDGTDIPVFEGKDKNWADLTTASYCWYDKDLKDRNTYGALYNWYTVATGKLCPKGWHVPTHDEWQTLIAYCGGEEIAGGYLKESGEAHWQTFNNGSTNSTGFTALPGGIRYYTGVRIFIKEHGYWWSSTPINSKGSWSFGLNSVDYKVERSNPTNVAGLSVRCLKDN